MKTQDEMMRAGHRFETLGSCEVVGVHGGIIRAFRRLEVVHTLDAFFPDAERHSIIDIPYRLADLDGEMGRIGRAWEAERTQTGSPSMIGRWWVGCAEAGQTLREMLRLAELRDLKQKCPTCHCPQKRVMVTWLDSIDDQFPVWRCVACGCEQIKTEKDIFAQARD